MTRRRRFSALQSLAALTGLLLVVACAVAPAPRPVPPPAPAPAPPPLRPAAPAAVIPAAPPPSPFQQFLDAMRAAGRAQGITEQTFAAATAGLAPIPTVTEANENQPEFSRPVWAYLDSAASPRRIRDGQFLLSKNRATLEAIATDSGVPPEILVAIWGMETDFGRVLGSHNIFAALATLGYQGPRTDFARPEFLAAP